MGVLVATAMAWPAAAQDSYVVGVSGALTGPAAGTNAPPIEGFRLYVDRLNASGGVNGNVVQIRRLRPGDRVGVGRSLLLFGSDQEIAARNAALNSVAAPVVEKSAPTMQPATISLRAASGSSGVTGLRTMRGASTRAAALRATSPHFCA